MPILAKQGIAAAWLPIKVTSVTPLYVHTGNCREQCKSFLLGKVHFTGGGGTPFIPTRCDECYYTLRRITRRNYIVVRKHQRTMYWERCISRHRCRWENIHPKHNTSGHKHVGTIHSTQYMQKTQYTVGMCSTWATKCGDRRYILPNIMTSSILEIHYIVVAGMGV